ncbi:MAG: glycoside hydrolase family 71/99-like protein [Lacipirellulaceae bacterium]
MTDRKTQLTLFALLLLVPFSMAAESQAVPPLQNNELDGKVFCGYQGWFGAPGDGTEIGFDNYRFAGKFEPGTCVIDYWPDLSEFDEYEKYGTSFRHADDSVAHVFSAANARTVDRHFQWMKEYGIDGIFLQRFGWALKQPETLAHRNQVHENVRKAAVKHGRIRALMYDLTSLEAGDIEKYVIPDFKRIARRENLASDSSYVRFHGQPVVAVWGIGFNDNRAYSLEECSRLIEFLKNDPVFGGNAVMLGVPYYWREQGPDTVDDPRFIEVIKQADIISPWAVGRYGTVEDAQNLMSETLKADAQWTSQNDQGYLPVIFPGFSWHNLTTAEGKPKPLNRIPRLGGKFLWTQAAEVKRAGIDMVYVAMFDEMNEGTCVFKCTNDPPVGESPFLTYAVDQLPSDHYLWLTGRIGDLMGGELADLIELPQRNPE